MKIHLISLGCPKNLVDSEKLLGRLGAAGADITVSPDDSDVIILNTCGFIQPALEETEHEIAQLEELLRVTGKKAYVYGCAVNRAEKELKKSHPGITGWFTLAQSEELLRTIIQDDCQTSARLSSTIGYTHLKIADGCSNCCSYCTIPLIKGPYRSVPIEELVKEAQELVSLGRKELILIAQDSAYYGVDLYGKSMLVPLIQTLSHDTNAEWLRIMYVHPKHLDHSLIHEIASNSKICTYLDMPIQHINDRILDQMNRYVTRNQIIEKLNELHRIKDICLRTTVIAGFPGETEDEFKELLHFLEHGYFTWVGVFPYYRESGTKAYLLPQVPQEVIEKRYDALLSVQHACALKHNTALIGTSTRTLFHAHNGLYIGHNEYSAPDIDGNILVADGTVKLGEFSKVRINGIAQQDVTGAVQSS
jgi:ribosomal protein S12 methylthiotransferase